MRGWIDLVYGYARCFANEKEVELTKQINELKQFGVTDETIYIECESKNKKHPSELEKLSATVKMGDTIVATDVTRITKSSKQLCNMLEFVQNNKLKIIIGSFIMDCTTNEIDQKTKGILIMLNLFSQVEDKIGSQRISDMNKAKISGKIIGRPHRTAENIPSNFYKNYPIYKKGQISKKGLARLCQVSYPTILKYLKITEDAGIVE